jgi:16S rRNA (uracil1498-N3)-methyltransferase
VNETPAENSTGEPLMAWSDGPAYAARRAAAHVIVAELEAPELDPADRHHLGSVLRLRPGEVVSVTDGRGGWRPCRVSAGCDLVPEGDILRTSRPEPPVTVGFAPVKGDRPEWAVQKLTELGVDRIVVLVADRSVVRWEGERRSRHLDKLRVVAHQAAMQSRQLWLPEVTGPEAVRTLAAYPGVAMAAPGGAPPNLAYPTVLVGPEGGWTAAEMEAARSTVDLGPGLLRTESAAVAAGVLLTALRAGLVQAR